MDLSVCGLVCSECVLYPNECAGCREAEGKPSWVEGEKVCELYSCCADRNFNSCGDCLDLPCTSFVELKDPSLSDEEHLRGVDRRVERLKKR